MKTFIQLFILFLWLTAGMNSCKTEAQNTFTDHAKEMITGYAEVNGTKLYYEMLGEGEPIVFVHGNFGDRRHWDFQFIPLSEKYKVVRYDVRGYGKSALPTVDQSYNNSDDLKALLEFLRIEKAHICGVSSGSSIAIDFALTYPGLCNSLIPIGPWVGGYGFNEYKTANADSFFTIYSAVFKVLKNNGTKAATDYWWTGDHSVKTSVRAPAALDSLLKMGYEYSYWGFLNDSKLEVLSPPAIRRLNEIKLPTLIVTAEYDIEACKEVAEILDQQIASATKISINDGGHLMNMDKPDEFNRVISDFMNKVK